MADYMLLAYNYIGIYLQVIANERTAQEHTRLAVCLYSLFFFGSAGKRENHPAANGGV